MGPQIKYRMSYVLIENKWVMGWCLNGAPQVNIYIGYYTGSRSVRVDIFTNLAYFEYAKTSKNVQLYWTTTCIIRQNKPRKEWVQMNNEIYFDEWSTDSLFPFRYFCITNTFCMFSFFSQICIFLYLFIISIFICIIFGTCGEATIQPKIVRAWTHFYAKIGVIHNSFSFKPVSVEKISDMLKRHA